MEDQKKKNKFFAQDNLYNFPYHYLPEKIGDKVIKPFRVYYWLYDYLLLHEYLKDKLKDFKNFKILDFGCGDGKLINSLKGNNNNELFGYEISKKASLFFKAFNPEIDLIENENELTKFENFFDLITFSEVIEHIKDEEIEKNINKIHMILKRNGHLIVTAPHENLPVHKKHYRHYNFQKLMNSFPSEKYELVEKKFLFTSSLFKTLVRKIFFNRFFIINSNLLYKIYFKLNKIYFFSSEKKCETIFLILKKK